MSDALSLQERYAPQSICFGCGPANAQGLQIRSFPIEAGLRTLWRPQSHHAAFPGVMNGGIIGSLLDCHCNWTATHHFIGARGANPLPLTVTAEYTVKLRRPTPMDREIEMLSRCTEIDGDKVTVEAELSCDGKITARCHGVFVAVSEGHPALAQWR